MFTVVTFRAAFIGGGLRELQPSPHLGTGSRALVHGSASPKGMPMWNLSGICSGSQVSRSRIPGAWVRCLSFIGTEG